VLLLHFLFGEIKMTLPQSLKEYRIKKIESDLLDTGHTFIRNLYRNDENILEYIEENKNIFVIYDGKTLMQILDIDHIQKVSQTPFSLGVYDIFLEKYDVVTCTQEKIIELKKYLEDIGRYDILIKLEG
jgi:hypothetical protein